MKTTRRSFLKAALTTTAAGLLVPSKTIFLPPKGGWPVTPVKYIDVYVSEFGVHEVRQQIAGHVTEENLRQAIQDIWQAGGEPAIIGIDPELYKELFFHAPSV